MVNKGSIYGDFLLDVSQLEGHAVELRNTLDNIIYDVENNEYNNLEEDLESIGLIIGWIEGDVAQITNEWYSGKEEEIREELRKEIL